ncbi:MAG: energy transducer TonB [Gammaproteobacteria bacterium]|nr:energy transducer TonB [Gammaproteobacteria bacterium]
MTAIHPVALEAEPVDTGDRLSFTVFLAVALHALLILGITFSADFTRPPPPTLEITLASHRSDSAPQQADYLAEFNQLASGTETQARQLTSDQLAPIDDTLIQPNNPLPQQRAVTVTPSESLVPVVTRSESKFQARVETAVEEELQQPQEGMDEQDTPLSTEIASLRARLDKQRRAIAKKPRLRRITSVATRASTDAAYLNQWTSKVEYIGNRNFPQQAIQQQIFGKLRLATTLRSNGSVQSVEILQSSGHPILDEAAVQIVHLASPFPPFPLELRKDIDQLEIIRTWHFELSGLSTSSSAN